MRCLHYHHHPFSLKIFREEPAIDNSFIRPFELYLCGFFYFIFHSSRDFFLFQLKFTLSDQCMHRYCSISLFSFACFALTLCFWCLFSATNDTLLFFIANEHNVAFVCGSFPFRLFMFIYIRTHRHTFIRNQHYSVTNWQTLQYKIWTPIYWPILVLLLFFAL